MSKEKRLGRGLEALLGRVGSAAETPENMSENSSADWHDGRLYVPVGEISANPWQPRKAFDAKEMKELVKSLGKHGLLQPLVVRKIQEGEYELVAGERRLRAAKEAQWDKVPVVIVDADERTSAEMAIVENMQRKDLNPIEKAKSFRRYVETYACTQEELAKRLKVDRSTVANLMRLLDLPDRVCQAVCDNKISQGHARALLGLNTPELQISYCHKIEDEKLSVRQIETLVKEFNNSTAPLGVVSKDGKKAKTPDGGTNSHLEMLQEELRRAVGSKIAITHNAKGRGKITIEFSSHDEFERIREYLVSGKLPETKAG